MSFSSKRVYEPYTKVSDLKRALGVFDEFFVFFKSPVHIANESDLHILTIDGPEGKMKVHRQDG